MQNKIISIIIIFILFIVSFLTPCILKNAIIYNPAKDIVPKLKVSRLKSKKKNIWKNLQGNIFHKKANLNLRMLM